MITKSYLSAFLVSFVSSTLICGSLMLLSGTPIPLGVVIMFGLLVTLVTAPNRMEDSFHVYLQDKQTGLEKLKTKLAESGYRLETETDTLLTYKPSIKT